MPFFENENRFLRACPSPEILKIMQPFNRSVVAKVPFICVASGKIIMLRNKLIPWLSGCAKIDMANSGYCKKIF